MHDLRHITCGLVPKIQQMLARAGAGGLELRVQTKAAQPIVDALGSLTAWELAMDGIDDGDDESGVVVRFAPRPAGSPGVTDDPLNRV